MRTLLRAVTTRYGVVGILVLGILVVVGVARLMGGESERPGSGSPGEDLYASASLGPDDGVIGSDDPAAVNGSADPTTLPKGVPDPLPVAKKFVVAWASSDGVTAEQWRARVAKYATQKLNDYFAHYDPTTEPSVELTGEPELTTVYSRGYVQVSVEAKDGTVLLGMRLVNGRWKVDTTDWRDR